MTTTSAMGPMATWPKQIKLRKRARQLRKDGIGRKTLMPSKEIGAGSNPLGGHGSDPKEKERKEKGKEKEKEKEKERRREKEKETRAKAQDPNLAVAGTVGGRTSRPTVPRKARERPKAPMLWKNRGIGTNQKWNQ